MIIQHGLAKAGTYTAPAKKQETAPSGSVPAKSSEHKLSAKAADFLAGLRSSRKDFDFIVADAGDDFQALAKQSDKEFTVIYSSADVERMARDPKFAAEKEQAIKTTLSMTEKICAQEGYVRTFGKGGQNKDGFDADRSAIDAFIAQHDMLHAQQTAAAMSKVNEGRQVALEIYRRMAGGAIVSQSDEQSLMKYDPNMYQAAKMSQQMAKKHEDMSDEQLMAEFEKRHENDRTDWTSELDGQIEKLNESQPAEPAKLDIDA